MKTLAGLSMFIPLILLIVLVSCISEAQPNERQVRVSTGYAPTGCQYRGTVTSVQKDINGGQLQTTQSIQINKLRKQVAQLGGNLLLITGQKSHYYDEYFVESGDITRELEAHAMTGRAYLCGVRR